MHTPSPRYRTLDAWRGIAALAVVLFHSFGRLAANEQVTAWFEPLRRVSQYGWLGVTLFFVISGYCIADQLERMTARGGPVSRFWLNRLLRIYPPYLAALAFAIALNVVTTPFNHLPLALAFPSGAKAWLGDLTLLHFPFDLPIHLTVSWSLAVEVGFYLVCGLGLLLPSRYFRILGFSLAAGVFLPPLPQPLGFLNFWPHFFSGMLAYWAILQHRNGRRAWATIAPLVLIGLVALLQAKLTDIVAVAFAGGIVALAPYDASLAGRKPVKWLAAAGVFSYSIYLIHLPVLSKVTNFLARFVRPDSPFYPLGWCAAIVLALGASWCFHKLVELPSERWRHKMLKA
ncbi:MAG TPA: acyltransferase [Opitutaceae bacterium]|nr:acyltransferase [Opitutaceae bacterium]